MGVLGRWNFAPIVAGMGLLLWFGWGGSLGERLRHFVVYGASSLILVLAVHFTVQVPVTGVWELSSILSHNMMETISWRGLKIDAAHGPRSEYLLHLARLEPLPNYQNPYDEPNTTWYLLWQRAGPWATEAEREAYLNQEATGPYLDLSKSNIHVNTLHIIYYLGPYEFNRLMTDAFFESVSHQFWPWLQTIPSYFLKALQPSLRQDSGFPNYSLPRADLIEFGQGANVLGFVRALNHETSFYNGQWVWRPGIEIFSFLFGPLNALRYLVYPALIWALWARHRIYTAAAFLLLLHAGLLATIDFPEPRIYAIAYPLGPVLVGGFLLAVWEKLPAVMQRNRNI